MRICVQTLLVGILLWSCSGASGPADSGEETDGRDGADSSSDPGEPDGQDGDAGVATPWSWCPDATAYQGGDWEKRVAVTVDALYCNRCACGLGTSDPPADLLLDLHNKSRLRFIAGSYPFPDAPGDYPFLLPLCLEFREEDSQPIQTEPGRLIFTVQSGQYNIDITQPLQIPTGERWCLLLNNYNAVELLDDSLLLDGRLYDPRLDPRRNRYWRMSLSRDDCQSGDDLRSYESCSFAGVEETSTGVVFQGGAVTLRTRLASPEAGGHGIFLGAQGTLDDAPFDQQDFFGLGYASSLHYLLQHFEIIPASPLGQICALRIEDLQDEAPFGRLYLLRCDGSVAEERGILSAGPVP